MSSHFSTDILVAAAGSPDSEKRSADFVCAGSHDERTLAAAVDECFRRGGNLYLADGIYRVDGFFEYDDGGPAAALRFPGEHREIRVTGQNHEYGFQRRFDNGVVLYVSLEALESAGDAGADVIRSAWTASGIQNGSSLYLENIAVVLANNQHPVRAVDLRRTDRAEVKDVTLVSYGDLISPDSEVGLGAAPPVPAKGCIGLTMTDGSNYNVSNYINVHAYGFDEGIQVGGEHVVCVNCGATIGRYGFTFGNYPSRCGSNHPITLINCLDERNINLPYFGRWCGDDVWGSGERLHGNQEVSLISFNMERTERVPGGVLGDRMREEIPGIWRGYIDFTAQSAWNAINDVAFQLFEEDGSGSGITARNAAHKAVCGTAERMSYYPTLGERVFDLDLNRSVVCVDPSRRLWVDEMGGRV